MDNIGERATEIADQQQAIVSVPATTTPEAGPFQGKHQTLVSTSGADNKSENHLA